MSKKRMRLTAKSCSLPYLEISPSKKRSVRRRTLSTGLKNSSPVLATPENDMLPKQTNIEETEIEESPCDDDPLCFDFSERQTPSYTERQQKSAENWCEMRELLLHAAVEAYGYCSGDICIACDHAATVVCYDCGPQAFFCNEHIEKFHSKNINIFHIPLVCQVFYFNSRTYFT